MAWPKGKPRKQPVQVENGNGSEPEPEVIRPPMKRGPRPRLSSTLEGRQAQALSGFDIAALGAAIAKGVVEGMKASAKEATREKDERTEQHRLRMRAQLNEDRASNMKKWENCSHMRSHPYSGTSRIAWATQSDGITRGTCMHCGCPFSPVASELPDFDGKTSPRMLDWYKRMIGVPMTAAQNDFITGMVAAGNPA